MSILTESMALVIYDDANAGNNPSQKFGEWRKTVAAEAVSNPTTDKYTLTPAASQVLFSGSRTIGVDNTSVFSLALNSTRCLFIQNDQY